MKSILMVVFICLLNDLKAQPSSTPIIDSSNYYNFYMSSAIKTKWLEEEDILPAIKEVLEENKIHRYFTNSLLRVSSDEFLRLTVYLLDYNVGLLYGKGHTMTPNKLERGLGTDELFTDYKFFQRVESLVGEVGFFKFKKLPDNIIFLPQNSYWYQEWKDSKNISGVSKDVIIRIFKEDFKRELINKLKK